jgi:hypothetical protein
VLEHKNGFGRTNVVEDRFHRAVYNQIQPMLDGRIANLVQGSAFHHTDEAKTTSEKYAEQVGYINALMYVLNLCEQIEADFYGPRGNKEG